MPSLPEQSTTKPAHASALARTADTLSYVLHPAVLMLLTVFLVSNQLRHDLALTLLDMAILLGGLLPGLAYIIVKTRRGDFTHYHLLVKQERRIVLPLLLLGMVASLVVFLLIRAPELMIRDMLIGLVAGLGAVVISRYWKISLHSAVAAGCAALLIPISPTWVFVFAVLAVLVGLARLIVKHHTLAQVAIGWIYGFGAGGALVWLLILTPSS